jgi:hypothetical protein
VLVFVSLAACGPGRPSVAKPRPTGSTIPSATTASIPSSSLRTETTAAKPAIVRTLAVIPTPTGYVVSTASDQPNGRVDPAEFDKRIQLPGLAKRLGFIHGYDETYEASEN